MQLWQFMNFFMIKEEMNDGFLIVIIPSVDNILKLL